MIFNAFFSCNVIVVRSVTSFSELLNTLINYRLLKQAALLESVPHLKFVKLTFGKDHSRSTRYNSIKVSCSRFN